ncbi:dynamin family protein [Gracilibacillus sp. S3-1-1]|uniref:Dynamin family protein n=1 Tax=Gracilibacillus pellucidus TaxID=3095368 RepID=A0ACC6M808_9BACI|nr:dynamin family protein [Gracilibacillus sp. S3-1-1]MDX8047060.1 dynamin family protein [Gracilibacillus sp. S3-1-1]
MLTTSTHNVDKQQLADLYSFFGQHNEQVYQEQMLDYYDKLHESMIHICFSGHFSAGKSTIINQIMNESLLPQSPIPTSANIVEIKKGEEAIIVHFAHQSAIKMNTLPTVEHLQELCRDGDEVKKIEIFKQVEGLPNGVTLMDTPGIDAANDADRIMTESALHQVDVMFYVMDYNHVQSEVNAHFLKQIDEMNKPYYVIINQMDKHDETELPFTAFQKSLEHVLVQWDIRPEQVFFTSMQTKDNVINQFDELKRTIDQLCSTHHQDVLQNTLSNGVHYSVKDAIKNKQIETNEQLTELQEKKASLILPEHSFEEIGQRLESLQEKKKNIEKDYNHQVEQTTKNAQLMPFDIREKAEHCLQAYDPKFKTGLFRNRKKIEQEREERLDTFYQALKEKVEANLEWKLRDKMTAFMQEYITFNFSEQVFKEQFSKKALVDMMSDGATANGEYVLVYTDHVANEVKKIYRQYYKTKWMTYKEPVLGPIEEQITEIQEQMNILERSQSIQQKVNEIQQVMEEFQEKVESHLMKQATFGEDALELLVAKSNARIVHKIVDMKELTREDAEKKEAKQRDISPKEEHSPLYSFNETIADLEKVEPLLANISGLSTIRQEIFKKKNRLRNRSFTIALFGAFSAGKSSFANALIGEKVLPASPNPTTAAINKISPPTEQYNHKDVRVAWKQERELLADLQEMLLQECQSLDDAYKIISKTKIDQLDIADKYKSFLTAFYNGYTDMKDKIGTEYTIDFTTFQRYVRDEEVACFVKEMELFYDCPLTENKITLVDTPGADSVNARHTDLAFSYMKDADAILFVTYYNHPFSKPDKQFLERLGNVKDAFELDKMFFIINAIDLAKDKKEAALVHDYVTKELQQFDINNPRMYAVSSKQAVEEKTEATGLPSFEADFYHFVQEELTQMSMRSIYMDLSRAKSLVSNWLSIMNGDQAEKERLMTKAKNNQHKIEHVIQERNESFYLKQIQQKLTKQIYYAKQRFSIQYDDVFKDYVNPGAIQSSGRKGKNEVAVSLQQLVQAINLRLTYEYQAIFIRVEQHFHQIIRKMREDTLAEIQKLDPEFSLSAAEDYKLEEPNIDLTSIDPAENTLGKWSNHYKDSKSFFSGNGQERLKTVTNDYFTDEWQLAMERLEQDLLTFYEEQWNQADQQVWSNHTEEVQDYYRHVIEGMEGQEENKEELKRLYEQLNCIVTSHA